MTPRRSMYERAGPSAPTRRRTAERQTATSMTLATQPLRDPRRMSRTSPNHPNDSCRKRPPTKPNKKPPQSSAISDDTARMPIHSKSGCKGAISAIRWQRQPMPRGILPVCPSVAPGKQRRLRVDLEESEISGDDFQIVVQRRGKPGKRSTSRSQRRSNNASSRAAYHSRSAQQSTMVENLYPPPYNTTISTFSRMYPTPPTSPI
jgi:hypothetical protein